ncbi:hypothetical protein OH76DRAFT_41770 [Lentinus brumalis]|uniref:Uncharacterized protein n=1 Tax=Lentinus brumalis TaxID=2498619 RepID=A0A371DY38_9APHY|nr:hypothetical protein OH76DRAFT_41770 [Polyporus brumalis]
MPRPVLLLSCRLYGRANLSRTSREPGSASHRLADVHCTPTSIQVLVDRYARRWPQRPTTLYLCHIRVTKDATLWFRQPVSARMRLGRYISTNMVSRHSSCLNGGDSLTLHSSRTPRVWGASQQPDLFWGAESTEVSMSPVSCYNISLRFRVTHIVRWTGHYRSFGLIDDVRCVRASVFHLCFPVHPQHTSRTSSICQDHQYVPRASGRTVAYSAVSGRTCKSDEEDAMKHSVRRFRATPRSIQSSLTQP